MKLDLRSNFLRKKVLTQFARYGIMQSFQGNKGHKKSRGKTK